MENDDIRIKFTTVQRDGKRCPKYSIYFRGKYQGDVYAARQIEPFIAAIPTNA